MFDAMFVPRFTGKENKLNVAAAGIITALGRSIKSRVRNDQHHSKSSHEGPQGGIDT